ncbi:ComEA family DNA-binding protein [Fodinibius sediminis]|uniref:ComEA protein n=1 Tax=Fodinibius sediminis TaxID=1214077 RepID=A0A521EDL4_9BACT|nr:helix-hairpin-helix domain-containing protein [Fodinibius sediminis]SMO82008.1 comEA protein [Fodinibius sediminis]
MRRNVFFWLEKLKITPGERRVMSVLMIILSLLALGNLVFSSPEPFAEDRYRELSKQFRERTAQLKTKQQKRMERYYPPRKKERRAVVRPDTVSDDTISSDATDATVGEPKKGGPEPVNVNTAGREQLKTLPGIGPAYSKRIIDYRKEKGAFKTVEELKKIKGIGEKRLEKLKPFIKLKDPL